MAAYERAAQLDAHDHDTRLLLAQLETARGHDQEAQRWLMQVIEGSPDDELVSRAARAAMQLSLPSGPRDELELRLMVIRSAAAEQRMRESVL